MMGKGQWGGSERREWLRVQHSERTLLCRQDLGTLTSCGGKPGSRCWGRDRRKLQSLVMKQLCLGKEGSFHPLVTYQCSWTLGAFGGIPSGVNNRKNWPVRLWTALLDCRASLGTAGFVCSRGMDHDEQRAREKEVTSVILGHFSWWNTVNHQLC